MGDGERAESSAILDVLLMLGQTCALPHVEADCRRSVVHVFVLVSMVQPDCGSMFPPSWRARPDSGWFPISCRQAGHALAVLPSSRHTTKMKYHMHEHVKFCSRRPLCWFSLAAWASCFHVSDLASSR